MKYLFDSSAIFRVIKENKIDVLIGNYTLELARYELVNIVWKDCVLQAKISEQESKLMIKAINHTLNIIDVLSIASGEEGILETAMMLKITFYDACYAYFAKAKELHLITEDSSLIKKITPTIDVSTLDNI
jgi:predicted nucleic acid-binding protein